MESRVSQKESRQKEKITYDYVPALETRRAFLAFIG